LHYGVLLFGAQVLFALGTRAFIQLPPALRRCAHQSASAQQAVMVRAPNDSQRVGKPDESLCLAKIIPLLRFPRLPVVDTGYVTNNREGTCNYNWCMEGFFAAISISLAVLTVLAFVWIVRDVFLLLSSEDQASLRTYWEGGAGFRAWRKRDRAIREVWIEHARSFPRSRKRFLFAFLLIACFLSVMGYPLWLTFGAR
jgi:hypothetical protein